MGKIESVNGLVLEGDIPYSEARGITLGNGAEAGTPEGLTFKVKEELDTPEAVYRATRDINWLAMPEPCTDEIYMLMHINNPHGLLGLKVTGCDYTVSIGNVKNGVFVPLRSSDTTGGSIYEDEILYSEGFAELEGGTRQVMVKVSKKENAEGAITKFEIAPHSAHTNPTFCAWSIVEIWAKVPSATQFKISFDGDTTKKLNALKYLRIAGENSITSLGELCSQLQNLTAVLELDTSSVTSAGFAYFCRDCPRLLAIPPVKVEHNVNIAYAFYNCGLKRICFKGGNRIYRIYSSTFSFSHALEELEFDTSGITSDFEITRAFCLKSFIMDTTSLAGSVNLAGLYSLSSLTFKTSGNVPASIRVANCGLSYGALLETLSSIPQASGASTLTLTGTEGAAALTDDDIAAMTAKNWTVVI